MTERNGRVPGFHRLCAPFGKSWADEDFEPWFDLDLDGEVGFSDFLIFAKVFGQPFRIDRNLDHVISVIGSQKLEAILDYGIAMGNMATGDIQGF